MSTARSLSGTFPARRGAPGGLALAALALAGVATPALAHVEPTLTGTTAGPTAPVLERPRLLDEVSPVYPESARREGLTGTVRLTIDLTATGTITRVRLLEGVRADLDEAALTAARALRFTPALRDGVPVPATIRYHFHFAAPAVPLAAAPASTYQPSERVADASTATTTPTLAAVQVRDTLIRRSASEVVRDRAVLQAAPHRSADELLFVVPGVFITRHSGEGKAFQIFYRGFDAVHGQDLEIWAAGAPVNDVSNIHGQGYADLHFIPVETVRQLTATPGTYDPHQGDFAVAGTLRFDLGLERTGITSQLELGQFDTRRVFLGYRPEGAHEATFGAVELYHTGGFGPSRAADRAAALGQWVVDLGDQTSLRLFASGYTGQFATAGVLRLSDIESGAVDRFATYDPTQGGSATRAQVVAAIDHRDDVAHTTFSTYAVLRSFRLRENFTGFLKDPDGDSEQQLNDAIVVGATGSYRRTVDLFSPKDAIEVGMFARADWIEQSQRRLSVTDGSVTAQEVDAKVRGYDIAGYLDLALHPIDRLTLRGGARLDGLGYASQDNGARAAGQARSSQGSHLGAKASADLRILPTLHAVLSYGDGFRSPQARSLAENQTTPFTRVHSGELGLQGSLSWIKGSVAGFYTTLSDDLVFDQATNRNERVPSTERLGVTADAQLELVEGLTLVGSLTYTQSRFTGSDARFAEGDLVPYAPQLVGRIDGSYTRALGTVLGLDVQARIGGALSVLARRPLPYAELGHDIALVDATAGLRVGPVELGVECFNLLDADYYDGEFVFATRWDPSQAGSLVPDRLVTSGAPRTLLATLSIHI